MHFGLRIATNTKFWSLFNFVVMLEMKIVHLINIYIKVPYLYNCYIQFGKCLYYFPWGIWDIFFINLLDFHSNETYFCFHLSIQLKQRNMWEYLVIHVLFNPFMRKTNTWNMTRVIHCNYLDNREYYVS